MDTNNSFFAPQLFLLNVAEGMAFYKNALGATELRKWTNPDGSVHVAELSIQNALFHLHEEVLRKGQKSAESVKTTTVLLGLFHPNPDELFQRAIKAGAKALNPMQDYDYGYRQGTFIDPFGHQWMIEKKI